jgi:hypothetical protein
MKLSLRVLPVLALPAVAACNFHLGDSTAGGDTGRVTFSYESGDGCFFGCAMDPLMVGTTELVNAQLASTYAGATVVVDDPSVLSVSGTNTTCCTTSGSSSSCNTSATQQCQSGDQQSLGFEVTALRTGSTKLRVMQGASEIDGIVLSIAAPAQITPYCGQGPASTVSMATGDTCAVGWTVNDAQGNKLQGSQGISLSVADPGVAVFTSLGVPAAQSVPDAQMGALLGSSTLEAFAPGQTQLVATVGGISGQVPVSVKSK